MDRSGVFYHSSRMTSKTRPVIAGSSRLTVPRWLPRITGDFVAIRKFALR